MVTLLIGFLFGFIGSIPVAGPVSAVVFERALAGRGRSGFFVALGGALAESIYAFMAAWGLGGLLTHYPALMLWSRGLGALILLALGALFAFRPPKLAQDTKKNPSRQSSAFVAGFLLTALNPTLVVTWGAAVTTLYATGLVAAGASNAVPFAAGACVGIVAWFATLLALVRHFHARLTPAWIRNLVGATGGLLLVLGAWFAVRFVQVL